MAEVFALKAKTGSGAFIKKATQSQCRKSSSKKLRSNFKKSDLR